MFENRKINNAILDFDNYMKKATTGIEVDLTEDAKKRLGKDGYFQTYLKMWEENYTHIGLLDVPTLLVHRQRHCQVKTQLQLVYIMTATGNKLYEDGKKKESITEYRNAVDILDMVMRYMVPEDTSDFWRLAKHGMTLIETTNDVEDEFLIGFAHERFQSVRQSIETTFRRKKSTKKYTKVVPSLVKNMNFTTMTEQQKLIWNNLESKLIKLNEESIKVTWDQIIGHQSAKADIENGVMNRLVHPYMYTPYGGPSDPTTACLLFGHPGTAKTTFVKAIAARANVNFLGLNGADLKGQMRGDSEIMVSTAFMVAEYHGPTILFFDEVENMMRDRSLGGSGGEETIGIILQKMSEAQDVIVMAATNLPWTIDSAFVRRFKHKVFLDLPDETARMELIELELKNYPSRITHQQLISLAKSTKDYSGDDIHKIMNEIREKNQSETYSCEYFKFCNRSGKYYPVFKSQSKIQNQTQKASFEDLNLHPINDIACKPITFEQVTEGIKKHPATFSLSPSDTKKKMEDFVKFFHK